MRRPVLFLVVASLLTSLTAVALSAGGGDITFDVKGADPVHFSHDYHLKLRGLKCSACHFQKFAKGATYEMKKEDITKRGFCGHCHNGLKGFDLDSEKNCIRCHTKKQ
jgi:c(7)-type cytochrome triheme protein